MQYSPTDLIRRRVSTRHFLDRPVAANLVLEIMEVAGNSPSGGNLQPWQVHVLAGTAKEALCATVSERCLANPAGETPDIPIYPHPLGEPWRSRRQACGELMYDALGIPSEDKMGRMGQVMKNFSFFDAPVGLLFTQHRGLVEAQALEIGIFMQSIMLLAQERELATCPQASWRMWPATIREVLCLDDDQMVIAGMALGYPKFDEPVNSIRQPRAGTEDYVSMYGFNEQTVHNADLQSTATL